MTNNNKISVYSRGLIHCSVCAPASMEIEEIEKEVNICEPTGIDSKWKVSKDKHFASGQPNPNQCESDPKMRHYLMNC